VNLHSAAGGILRKSTAFQVEGSRRLLPQKYRGSAHLPESEPVDGRPHEVYSEARVCGGHRGGNSTGRTAMNLPNTLTLLRIFFVPLLIVVLLTRTPNLELWGVPVHFEVWGVLILLAAAATDWADGYFARRRFEVTTLGILLDPIADKLLISAAFISLVDMHLAPAWMVVIIIGREVTVLGLRNIASAEGLTIMPSVIGKTKMVLQVIAGATIILGVRHAILKRAGILLLWLVVVSAMVSAAQYFLRFWSQLDDRIKQRHSLRVLERSKKPQDVATL
jgi:CDP-diacylglycerol---glycerol-3-phosphate 3-phosphatidyltransferase